ncbi:zinc metalloproteinase nas-13 [Trichonephila inaurata madagascariensis]|uniref:Metalloendopeptidase n=1 Tax=Trichonephila inaurata madagascariensis TaxID=2747483 RepID=A0A8X6Y0G3_9ARAC|nr:zinc metalloproteinase nas-13 [Trichonephila inaurata madagascariensis]
MFHLNLLLVVLLAGICKAAPNFPKSIDPLENLGHARLFQGDIYIRNGTLFQDRFATKHKYLRWPNGIVFYTLDEIYSESEKLSVSYNFPEYEKQNLTKISVLLLFLRCWSELGRVGGVQSLALESPACMKKGLIMHELMHALGFLHEQSRFDRDEYVKVVWSNIIEGMEPNFEKLYPAEIDDLSLDYDYRSIMHYRAFFFAKDRSLPTLRPTDKQVPLKALGIGQAEGTFSQLDIQKINKFYECP